MCTKKDYSDTKNVSSSTEFRFFIFTYCRFLCLSACLPASQPASQPVSQPGSQPASQPVSESVSESASQLLARSLAHSLTHTRSKIRMFWMILFLFHYSEWPNSSWDLMYSALFLNISNLDLVCTEPANIEIFTAKHQDFCCLVTQLRPPVCIFLAG